MQMLDFPGFSISGAHPDDDTQVGKELGISMSQIPVLIQSWNLGLTHWLRFAEPLQNYHEVPSIELITRIAVLLAGPCRQSSQTD